MTKPPAVTAVSAVQPELVATLLARDSANDYVLYAQDGLLTDLPIASNADVRLLRADPAHGETDVASHGTATRRTPTASTCSSCSTPWKWPAPRAPRQTVEWPEDGGGRS